MTSPTDLDHQQRRTWQSLTSHPIPHNLKWPRVIALLKAMGDEVEEHNDRYRVTFNGRTEVFRTLGRGNVPVDTIVKLRHFLAPANEHPGGFCESP